ncbi:MAG: hypothetical protein IKE21_01395 [Erysipelotrichaceae bacterium]|nr:hypothetical protein [Erysipelotrichaceae bacterium]
MELLKRLQDKETWQEYLQEKKERGQLSPREIRDLEAFIAEEGWQRVALSSFPLPEKKILSKQGSRRKRTVYTFPEAENRVLKVLAWLLYAYDGKISEDCYSFRKNYQVKTAVGRLLQVGDLEKKYVLKADIHDYFASIDPELLCQDLAEVLDDDPELLQFLREILQQGRCIYRGEEIMEKRGALPGVPVANFLANIYLKDLDACFRERGIPYFRYADDLLLLFDSVEEREEGLLLLKERLQERKLQLNEEKTCFFAPGEPISYLGLSCQAGRVGLSAVTVRKMQAKIRRKARRIYRQDEKENVPWEKRARSLIRYFDNKFYDLSGTGEFTWSRFYFPLLTETEGLSQIDRCLQEYLRYLQSGRHTKANYRIRYAELKKLGYTPLVAEFYRWKEENRRLAAQ